MEDQPGASGRQRGRHRHGGGGVTIRFRFNTNNHIAYYNTVYELVSEFCKAEYDSYVFFYFLFFIFFKNYKKKILRW